MSNLTASADAIECRSKVQRDSIEHYPTRDTELGGGLKIRRALPHRDRRLVGPWVFLDHFGPLNIGPGESGMRVGPHPHIGLQTVSWLFEGEVLHRDSLGYKQLIRPGQLNLMTAGCGIAHSEETPALHPPLLHGLQFWVALPSSHKDVYPAFEHHPELPRAERDGMQVHVFAGEALGARTPAHYYSPIAGLDVTLTDSGTRVLPLNPDFEYALLPVQGECEAEGEVLAPDALHYLGVGRESITLGNKAPARFGLFGGAPFGEKVILWWNFVAHTPEEILRARADWEQERPRFGAVKGYNGPRLDAPPITGRFKAS